MIIESKFNVTVIAFCIDEVISWIIICFCEIDIFLQLSFDSCRELFAVWIFHEKVVFKIERFRKWIADCIRRFCRIVMINFLWENFVSILIILILWLLISWLMICNVCLIIWHELTDVLQCFDYIFILILRTVWESRQILLSQKQVKILSRCWRWELNLLFCSIALLLKLTLWMIILLKFSDLLIERLINSLFSLRITLKLKWLMFHVCLLIFVLSESDDCWWDKKAVIM